MVIADLIDVESKERIGRVYLAAAPFPGDVIDNTAPELMVIRRRFLDLGPDGDAAGQLSVKLEVRPA